MDRMRSFRSGDGPGVVALWQRSAPADSIVAATFTALVLLDPNFDPTGLRIAVGDDGTVVGAICAMHRRVPVDGSDLEPTSGWITFFFVAPEARMQGVGDALLKEALRWLLHRGVTDIDFSGYTPNYFLPGLDRERYPAGQRLLERNGFASAGLADSMSRSLEAYLVPDEIAARRAELEGHGYTFGAPTDDELVGLVELARGSFSADWGRAIREAMANGLHRGHIVIATDPGGQTVGWAMHAAYQRIEERFGPFGVLDSQRGTGIGAVLLHLTLDHMRAIGTLQAWFLWADRGSAAHRLYERTGFVTTRTFALMHRTIRP